MTSNDDNLELIAQTQTIDLPQCVGWTWIRPSFPMHGQTAHTMATFESLCSHPLPFNGEAARCEAAARQSTTVAEDREEGVCRGSSTTMN